MKTLFQLRKTVTEIKKNPFLEEKQSSFSARPKA